jgi:oxygen-independent coproporphyrinogen-3 oxidase
LYVHLPWCVSKCPYCDFNSHAAPASLPEDRYVAALLADLDADLPLVAGREITSVFLGGGTPSLFSPAAIGRILAGAGDRLPFAAGAEITLEANPGTIERGRFEGYAAAGVNRVSLGAQTFSAARLAALGRIHGSDDIGLAVADLRAAGLANFNLDLMYGLPGQTVAESLADIQAAIALEPAHLSHYQLTLEPGTVFHHRPPPGLPGDDATWDMQVACQQAIAAAGFEQYEVSAYALPGRQCLHNRNYWSFGDYLGIGAGAHGKVTAGDAVIRTEKPKQPRDYFERVADGTAAARRTVAAADLPFEFMLNALRLRAGFLPAAFEAATGLPAASLAEPLARLAARGLMAIDGDRWAPTETGYRFLNDLQAEFLGAPGKAA